MIGHTFPHVSPLSAHLLPSIQGKHPRRWQSSKRRRIRVQGQSQGAEIATVDCPTSRRLSSFVEPWCFGGLFVTDPEIAPDQKEGCPVRVTESVSKCVEEDGEAVIMSWMHRDVNKAGRVDRMQVTKDLNTKLIYLNFFHEFNKELLKILSPGMAK